VELLDDRELVGVGLANAILAIFMPMEKLAIAEPIKLAADSVTHRAVLPA
jgi:hypothetical protein